MFRSQDHYRIVWAFSMIMLFAVAAFAPAVGGLLQQRHRTGRQGALRRGRMEMPVAQFIIPDTAVAGCFSPKDNELQLGGLRYDVISVRYQGNHFIFHAVLDLKESQFCALMSQNIQCLPMISGDKTGFTLFDFLLNPYVLPVLRQISAVTQSVFFEKNAGVLAGFKRVYAPPPDLYRLLYLPDVNTGKTEAVS